MTASPARRFSLAALTPAPWKNGGGVTREIAAMPQGAGMGDFDWRISVADIAADGPFSAFPGIDRQIVLLEGAGVRLRADDGRFDHRLDRVGEPFAFAGEAGVHASLLDGPTRDFNVMTRRGRTRARVWSAREAAAVPGGTQATVMLVIAGEWHGDVPASTVPMRPGDGLVLGPGAPLHLRPASAESHCLLVTLDLDATP
ncbi:HutD family protein [Cupriavidus respiraculi]|uniref:HutD/Ves family protein n=1 Tax=Cupriavidus respiraculi TaxID=195930 RepID=UPI001C98249E|nr:HutD family protein [Cupriavidus respiraculi]MBY4949193.1 HutD family protein [Cupriavidus respiraculi]